MNKDLISIITKQTYLAPSRYISGRIVEYDIKSANISCLFEEGAISEEEFIRLSNLPKLQREIEVGIMEKNNPSIYTTIQVGIKKAKMALAEANNIAEEQIIRIANDAVYIDTGVDLQHTKFGSVIEFRPKSVSNIYLKLNEILFFLSTDNSGNINVDIKGLGEENIKLHQDYMINGIISAIVYKERASTVEALGYLSDLCESYLKLALPDGFYREFNSASMYRIIRSPFAFNNIDVGFDNLQPGFDKSILDINYNYYVLRELWSVLIELYNLHR